MFKKIFFFTTFFILLICCNKKIDHLNFEKQVAYEIFPQLIDSLHQDTRLKLPKIVSEFSKKDSLTGEWIFDKKKVLKESKRKRDSLYKDSVKLITVVSDSTILLKESDKDALLNHFEQIKSLDTTSIDFKYQIDLEKLVADKKIGFKYASKFPKYKKFWNTNYDFYVNDVFSMSRIQFDSTFSYGVLKCGYGTGYLNGGGYRVFIKKEDDKWVIDEIILTEVS